MRAIQITESGGPEVLIPTELPDPTPGPGELLVEVAAAGVNYIDTYQRQGIYPMQLPYVPGMEGAGRVARSATGVDRVRRRRPGGLGGAAGQLRRAGRACRPTRRCRCRTAVSDEAAVGAALQGMTAHYLLHDTYPVRPGDDVLVHAAAGGVGLLLTQWATALGARVIATVSTAEKEELARAAGAAEVIRYTEVDDLAAEVRELTGGVGVAAVYDGVGRDHLRRQPGQPAPARHPGAVRGVQRPGAAGRPAAAQCGRLGVPHPAEARTTTSPPARS